MDDSVDEFVVNTKQSELLRKDSLQIEERFCIVMTFTTTEEDEDNTWIKLRGRIPCIQRCKTCIKALCNPEHQETLDISGFPSCIAVGLQRFWLDWIEFSYGAVIKQFNQHSKFIIQGTHLNVTRAVSILMHINNACQKDIQDSTAEEKFDRIVKECCDPYERELLQLRSAIKKDLLAMMLEAGRVFSPAKIRMKNKHYLPNKEPENEKNRSSVLSSMFSSDANATSASKLNVNINTGRPAAERGTLNPSKGSVGRTSPRKTSTSQKNNMCSSQDDTIEAVRNKHELTESTPSGRSSIQSRGVETILISDDEADADASIIFVAASLPPPLAPSDRDYDEEDGEIDAKPRLPQTMVIESWLHVNYEVTNVESDCVYKQEMLADFQRHFNLEDRLGLSNEFFSKLAQSVFDRDPKYSKVKSKGASGKTAKRRLVCIKQRATDSPTPATTISAEVPSTSKVNLNSWIKSAQPTQSTTPAPTNSTPREKQTLQISPHDELPIGSRPNQPFVANPDRIQTPSSPDMSSMNTRQLLHLPQTPGMPNLRPVVIDGSNVACSHGNGQTFSCRGLAICVRYFWTHGHRQITCFVPNFRKGSKGSPPITDQFVLFELEKMNIAKFTPSREVDGRPQVCYDDRFIIDLATITNGVIVSNDQYRDLRLEKPKWTEVIDKRLLQYTYVGDIFMLPEDPLGRYGPKLDQFLSLENRARQPQNPGFRQFMDVDQHRNPAPVSCGRAPHMLNPGYRPSLDVDQRRNPAPVSLTRPAAGKPWRAPSRAVAKGKKRRRSISLESGLAEKQKAGNRSKHSGRRRRANVKIELKKENPANKATSCKRNSGEKALTSNKTIQVKKEKFPKCHT